MVDPVPWQDTATAIGTIGATVAAVGLGLIAEWRTRADRRAAARSQAVKVTAWVDARTFTHDALPGIANGPKLRGTRYVFVVNNASDDPVWSVALYVPSTAPGQQPIRVGIVPPNAQIERPVEALPPEINPPESIRMAFKDAAGVWWLSGPGSILLRARRVHGRGEPEADPAHLPPVARRQYQRRKLIFWWWRVRTRMHRR